MAQFLLSHKIQSFMRRIQRNLLGRPFDEARQREAFDAWENEARAFAKMQRLLRTEARQVEQDRHKANPHQRPPNRPTLP